MREIWSFTTMSNWRRICLILTLIQVSYGCHSSAGDTLIKKKVSIDEVLKKLTVQAAIKESNKKKELKLIKEKTKYITFENDSLCLLKQDSVQLLIDQITKKNLKLDSIVLSLKQDLKDNRHLLSGGYNVSYKGVKYQIYIHNDTNLNLRVHHQDSLGKTYRSIANVRKDLSKVGQVPLMITNGGMYTPKNEPEGLFIEEYTEKFPIDTDSSKILLNFYMHPNGVFYLDSLKQPFVCTRDEYLKRSKDSTFQPLIATQSGPMLKINGVMHHRFNWGSTSRKLRSGVGIYEGMSVFAITRGRSNFHDFTSLFTEVFECENALFLDGAISKMYDPKLSPKELGGNFGPIISVSSKKEN